MLESPAVAQPLAQPFFRRRSSVLLGILLFLRLPLLVTVGFLPASIFRGVLTIVGYFIATYLVTALLIWSERDRLREFNIDTLALAIFALGKPLQVLLALVRLPAWLKIDPEMIALVLISAGFIIAWLRFRPALPGFSRSNLIWILIAAVLGALMAVISGFGLRYFSPFGLNEVRVVPPLSDFLFGPVIQMTNAATYEEPLFRGFLWGYLRKLGWKGPWILLFTAFLFWVGHLYYLQGIWYSLVVVVPMGGLLMGWLALRTRSTGVSIVAHGFANGIAAIIQALPV